MQSMLDSRRLLLGICLLLMVLAWPAAAQNRAARSRALQDRFPNNTRNPIPSMEYHLAYKFLDEGELANALDAAGDSLRGSPRGANGRFVDAVCYHVAIGESLYKQGQFAEALQQYENALLQFLRWSDWPLKIDWPIQQQIRPFAPVNVPWGQTKRQNVQVANLGENLLMNRGGLIPIPGGALNNAQKYPLNAMEIIRSTAVAMQRYRELTGPACQHEAIVSKLDNALATTFPPNHYSQCFGDILRGLVARMNNSEGEAYALFQRGRLMGGLYDHPLTPIAFYEMGSIAMERGDFSEAVDNFNEATYAQAYYLYPAGPTLMEQAFHNAYVCTQLSNRQAAYAPMQAAAGWARREKLMHLVATLSLDGAEESLVAGNTRQAQQFLTQTVRAFARRDMGSGLVGTRFKHLTAIANYQAGKMGAGDTALADALQRTSQGSSRWLLHMQLVDDRVSRGLITDIKALRLYEFVLREPARSDWLLDPLGTLAMLRSPHDRVYENWFELAVAREDNDAALEIADLARRHRFFRELPLGGRLLGLRWLLEGPEEKLSPDQLLLRRDLLTQYPAYAGLAENAARLQTQLRELPWKIVDQQQQHQQATLLEELAMVSQSQEVLLREMSVCRQVSSLSFPATRPTMEIRREMKDGQLALIFFQTSRNTYVFQIGKAEGQEVYGRWRIPSVTRALTPVKTFLRQLGNFGPNRVMRGDDLADTDWRQSGVDLMETIYGAQTMPEGVSELIVVPDGLFWYVPFEALQLPTDGDQTESLISRMQVRYSPTLGLMLPTAKNKTALPSTAVATGRMTIPEPEELIANAVSAMERDIPGAAAIPQEMPVSPAVYSALFDRLVILDEITGSATKPFNWSPLSTEKGGRGAITLADWFPLPFGAPQEMIMPGYHTKAEDGLKTQTAAVTGDEMFLSVMGMMSMGTRTVMISRWRNGGQTCYDLVREFVKELDSTSAAEAWQRCVFLALQLPVDPANEGRIHLARKDEQFNASHPFFWAGYMVFDSGLSPEASLEEETTEPDKATGGAIKGKDGQGFGGGGDG
ncbi:MAG: hypothetical protein MPJ50_10980 [Pirellulales bacterium]|nr:hypothetical protein [Pirellulales bacterium]